MSIATKAPVRETRLRFTGVGFDVYERLIRATPARTAVRMAYDGKDLEIVVKGPVHDHYDRLLDRFITAIAATMGIAHRGLGETTWIRPEIEGAWRPTSATSSIRPSWRPWASCWPARRTTSRVIRTPTWPSRSTSRDPRRTDQVSTRQFRSPNCGRSTARS